MPCNSVRTMTVTLEKCNVDTMTEALRSLALCPEGTADKSIICFGNGEYINCATGEAKLAWNRNANEIKQAYSRAIVQRAQKAGWIVKQNPNNQNQYQLIKR